MRPPATAQPFSRAISLRVGRFRPRLCIHRWSSMFPACSSSAHHLFQFLSVPFLGGLVEISLLAPYPAAPRCHFSILFYFLFIWSLFRASPKSTTLDEPRIGSTPTIEIIQSLATRACVDAYSLCLSEARKRHRLAL